MEYRLTNAEQVDAHVILDMDEFNNAHVTQCFFILGAQKKKKNTRNACRFNFLHIFSKVRFFLIFIHMTNFATHYKSWLLRNGCLLAVIQDTPVSVFPIHA